MLTDTNTAEITIRRAYPGDQLTLTRLAALDSADVIPPQPLLLAEVDGEPRVALSLADGSAIADPFHHTAAILALLRHHAMSLEPASRSRRHKRVLPWPHRSSGQPPSARGTSLGRREFPVGEKQACV
jgi:hypothetical protein